MADRMAVAARLRRTRTATGLSQSQFADAAGIARNTYNQHESGERLPSLEEALKLCSVYGLTLDWIYRGILAGVRFDLATNIGKH